MERSARLQQPGALQNAHRNGSTGWMILRNRLRPASSPLDRMFADLKRGNRHFRMSGFDCSGDSRRGTAFLAGTRSQCGDGRGASDRSTGHMAVRAAFGRGRTALRICRRLARRIPGTAAGRGLEQHGLHQQAAAQQNQAEKFQCRHGASPRTMPRTGTALSRSPAASSPKCCAVRSDIASSCSMWHRRPSVCSAIADRDDRLWRQCDATGLRRVGRQSGTPPPSHDFELLAED